MTTFEALTLILASLAVFVSVYTLTQQRKLQKEANELQRSNADLAKRQMQQIEAQEAAAKIARLAVDIVQSRNSNRIRISNYGDCDAHEVDIQFELQSPLHDPVVESDYKSKFPVKRLPGHTSVMLLANIHLNSPSSFDGYINWKNPDGTPMKEPFCAFLE